MYIWLLAQRYALTALMFSALIFVGALCTRAGDDGGVWRSDDNGASWAHKVFVEQQKRRTVTIGRVDVNMLTIDPANPTRLYLATRNNGAYMTDDAGEHWRTFVTNRGAIEAIAVSSRDAKIIFVVQETTLHRTEDGGTTWKSIFTTSRPEITITTLTLGVSDAKVVYIGLSDGDVLRSRDGGDGWTRVNGFGNPIVRAAVNPNDAKIVYVITRRRGLWRSADAGKTWQGFHEQLTQHPGADDGRVLALDPTVFDGVLYGSNFGILRTRDGGSTWTGVKTLSAPGSFNGTAVAVNPRDGNVLFYATPQNTYGTSDGGKTWKTIAVPSKRAVRSIIFQLYAPSTIYLGVAQEE